MSDPVLAVHAGSGFPVPDWERSRPSGEVTWVEADERAVSTSGPALGLSVDLYLPRGAGREQFMVVRLRDMGGYLPTSEPSYRDPDENLAVTVTLAVPDHASCERVPVVLPYVALPARVGGLVEAEIAVYEPEGDLVALSYFPVEIPEELERSPDLLSVVAHALVALSRTTGPITREEVRVIRDVLTEHFELDDLGDRALKRILKTANRAEHTPDTLAEVLRIALPADAHERIVDLLYAAARVDGEIPKAKRRFVEALLAAAGVHDHARRGPERLASYYVELEIEAGADWEAVRKAYKKAVRDYHPDRVASLAKGFQDYALERTKRLNEAYDALKSALAPETD